MNISGIKVKGFGNRGSTIIAVMVIAAILSLFIWTLLPISVSYARRSVDEKNLKQAEFSARGANDAIVKAILDGNTTLITGINSLVSNDSSLDLTGFTFPSSMGSVAARIKRISANEFNVITEVTVNGAKRTIGRVINKVGSTGGSSHSPLPAFDFFDINHKIITYGSPIVFRNTLNGGTGTDISINGDLYLLSKFNKSVGQALIVITGNFYTGDEEFDVSGSSTLIYKQKPYSKQNVKTLKIPAASLTTFNSIPNWVQNSGTNYQSTLSLSGGNYYVINSSLTISDMTKQLNDSGIQASNPVYIIVKPGNTLTLSNAIDASPVGGNPRVVFILEGTDTATATLNVRGQSSIIVFGSQNTKLNISGGDPTLYGQIRVGSISDSNGRSITLNYRASTTYNPNPGTVTWTAGQYIKTTY